jgi:hypothetical protein
MWLLDSWMPPEPTIYLMAKLKEVVALAKMSFNHFYVIDQAHSLRVQIAPNICA